MGGVSAVSGGKAPEALRVNIAHRVLPALPPFWSRLPSTRPTQLASCMHLSSQGPRRTGVVQRNSSSVEIEATLGEGIKHSIMVKHSHPFMATMLYIQGEVGVMVGKLEQWLLFSGLYY